MAVAQQRSKVELVNFENPDTRMISKVTSLLQQTYIEIAHTSRENIRGILPPFQNESYVWTYIPLRNKSCVWWNFSQTSPNELE
jgi:hypothetical protein